MMKVATVTAIYIWTIPSCIVAYKPLNIHIYVYIYIQETSTLHQYTIIP
jgi:hypothetical protein